MPFADVYVKKPVEVHAIQYTGENLEEIWEVFGSSNVVGPAREGQPFIYTLEGRMHFNPTDWIIKGTMGELYPVKDRIFRNIYDRKEVT